MGFRSEFSLEKSMLRSLSKAIPQGKRRLDRESAAGTTPHAETHHFEMLGFETEGFSRAG